MQKYLFRYLLFWLPALLTAYLLSGEQALAAFQGYGSRMAGLPAILSWVSVLVSWLPVILQWFFCFFMLFGWSVNTGMAAYHYPRYTLSLLLVYLGVEVLLITALFTQDSRGVLYKVFHFLGGLFCYKPLTILWEAVDQLGRQMSWPTGYVVLGIVVVCCLIGMLFGLIQRRVSPNPYRPRILKPH